jgi:hypothetical protein
MTIWIRLWTIVGVKIAKSKLGDGPMTVNADINKTLRTTDPAAGKVALALDLAATSGAGRSARRYYGDTLVNPHSMLFAVFASCIRRTSHGPHRPFCRSRRRVG